MILFSVKFCLTFVLYFVNLVDISGSQDYKRYDYWSDEFDVSQNCENKDEIERLLDLTPTQCTRIMLNAGNEEKTFQSCKRHLQDKVKEKCEDVKVDKPGILLYCKKRGYLSCCFRNETCATWSNMRKSSYEKAKEYLTNRENGGLFKCCVRRDKMACHECRFCCTLPMCTYPPGHKDNTIFDIEQKEEVKNQKNIVTADEIFFSDQHVYRSDNYYCLKPYSHENPRKWRRYEVAGFRKSFNKEMLENTTTFKFDKYLYNFVDPKIFNTFTKNDRKASKIWKKSYQWRYMRRVPGDESYSYVSSNGSWTNITKCVKKCIQMEKSAFAKKCKKGGGFFKCCVTRWRMHEFEEIRNQLIQDG